MCKFLVCSAYLGMLSCKMSQHTVPSYQENTTVTLSNNFFLPLSKEKSKTRDQFQTRKVPQEVGWRQLITCLPQICIKRCLFGFVLLLILHYSAPFPTMSISLASECLLDVGISGLLSQVLQRGNSAWPIWNYHVSSDLCHIRCIAVYLGRRERSVSVHFSVCKLMVAVRVWMCSSPVSHTQWQMWKPRGIPRQRHIIFKPRTSCVCTYIGLCARIYAGIWKPHITSNHVWTQSKCPYSCL